MHCTPFLQRFAEHLERRPGKAILTWVNDAGKAVSTLTVRDVDRRALAIEAHLRILGLGAGDSVLLTYPPGLDFVAALIACMRSRVAAISVYPPRINALKADLVALARVAADSGSRHALTTTRHKWLMQSARWLRRVDPPANLTWVCTDKLAPGTDTRERIHEPQHDDIVLIQYTSGSTGEPRGVAITYGSLSANLHCLQQLGRIDERSVSVCWLPQYHDYGLVVNYLAAPSAAAHIYGLSPLSFLKRPLLWAELIERYGATHIASPNSGYRMLCRDLKTQSKHFDFSTVQNTNIAAEPIEASTVNMLLEAGFPAQSIDQTYGCAEFAVHVSSGGQGYRRGFAACGSVSASARFGKHIVVADETGAILPDGQEGLIYVDGPDKALGYFNQPELTKELFHARLKGSDRSWYKTRDLGFIEDDQLYVTGRFDDVIIINGRNIYPQDLEQTTFTKLAGAVRAGRVAVVQCQNDAVGIIAETQPKASFNENLILELARTIEGVHGARLDEVLIIAKSQLPKTRSGKIKRHACLAMLKDEVGSVEPVFRWSRPTRKIAAEQRSDKRHIVIVGAGPAGLATAFALVRNGYTNITIVEANSHCGGKSVGAQGKNWLYLFSPCYRHIRDLALELDLREECLFTHVTSQRDSPTLSVPAGARCVSDLVESTPALSTLSSLWTQSGYGYQDDTTISPHYLAEHMVPLNDRDQFFFYPHGFLDRLWTALAARLRENGVQILLQTRVESVTRQSGETLFDVSVFNNESQTNSSLKCDTLFLSGGPQTLQQCIKEVTGVHAKWHELLRQTQAHRYAIVIFQATGLTKRTYLRDSILADRHTVGRPLYFAPIGDKWCGLVYVRGAFSNQEAVSKDELHTHFINAVEEQGGKLEEIDEIAIFDFFPHFNAEAMPNAGYALWTPGQGEGGVYLIGSTVAFECTEAIVRHAQALVNEHFPAHKQDDPEHPSDDQRQWLERAYLEVLPMLPAPPIYSLPKRYKIRGQQGVFTSGAATIDFGAVLTVDPDSSMPAEITTGLWARAAEHRLDGRLVTVQSAPDKHEASLLLAIANTQNLPLAADWLDGQTISLTFHSFPQRFPVHTRYLYRSLQAIVAGRADPETKRVHARWLDHPLAHQNSAFHFDQVFYSSSFPWITFTQNYAVAYKLIPDSTPESPGDSQSARARYVVQRHGFRYRLTAQVRRRADIDAMVVNSRLHLGRLNDSMPWPEESCLTYSLGTLWIPPQNTKMVDHDAKSPFRWNPAGLPREPAIYGDIDVLRPYTDIIEGVATDTDVAASPSFRQHFLNYVTSLVDGGRAVDSNSRIAELGLSSFQLVSLANYINVNFGREAALDELSDMTTVADLLDYIEAGHAEGAPAAAGPLFRTPRLLPNKPVDYARYRQVFEEAPTPLRSRSTDPGTAYDVLVIGAGLSGLFAAQAAQQHGLHVAVLEKHGAPGGVWSQFANSASRLNSSGPTYALPDWRDSPIPNPPANQIRRMCADIANTLAVAYETTCDSLTRTADGFLVGTTRRGESTVYKAREVVLCTARSLKSVRRLQWPGQQSFGKPILEGVADALESYDFDGKTVAIVGMGAFALEVMRTALERGASHVYIIARHQTTVTTRAHEYVNNITSPSRLKMQFRLLSDLYRSSQIAEPRCWQDGLFSEETIVIPSNEFFIASYYGLTTLHQGNVTKLEPGHIVLDTGERLDADGLFVCAGFESHSDFETELSGKTAMNPLGMISAGLHYFAEPCPSKQYFEESASGQNLLEFFGGSYRQILGLQVALWLRTRAAPESEDWATWCESHQVSLHDLSFRDLAEALSSARRTFPWVGSIVDDLRERKVAALMSQMPPERFFREDKIQWMLWNDLCSTRAGIANRAVLPYLPGRLLENLRRLEAEHVLTLREVVGSDPVWYFHGAASSPMDLQPCTPHLDFTVHALRWSAWEADSFEAIVTKAISQIRARQPRGPYRLLGYSMGGTLACAVAKQLERDAHTVEQVVVLDADDYTRHQHWRDKGRQWRVSSSKELIDKHYPPRGPRVELAPKLSRDLNMLYDYLDKQVAPLKLNAPVVGVYPSESSLPHDPDTETYHTDGDHISMLSSAKTPTILNRELAIPKTLSIQIFGSPEAPPLFFMSGFPDRHEIWRHQIDHFKRDYRVIVACLPDFDNNRLRRHQGYSWQQVGAMFLASVAKYIPADEPFTLVAHDLGVLVVNEVLPAIERRLRGYVMIGIGGTNNIEAHDLHANQLYQAVFAAVFRASRRPETALVGRQLKGSWNELSKTSAAGWEHSTDPDPAPWKFYLYPAPLRPIETPLCPVLFIYGARVPLHWHSPDFLQDLNERRDGSRYVALEAGHWLMPERPKEVNDLISEFVAQLPEADV